MNQKHFHQSLKLLGEATNKQLSPDLIRYWWTRYGDLPDDVLQAALQIALDTCKFFPSPAEFNDLLRQISASQGQIADGAAAWAYLQQRTIRKFRPGVAIRGEHEDDPYRSKQDPLDWPDEHARRIVREELGGIYALAVTEGEYARDQQRKRFIERYDGARHVEQAEATVTHLATPPAPPTPLPAQARPRLVAGDER